MVTSDRRPVSRASKWKQRLVLVSVSFAILAACIAIRYSWEAEAVHAQDQRAARRAPPSKNGARPTAAPRQSDAPKPQVVAVVNGEEISRNELGQECLAHFSDEVLESLINKHLIAQYCKQNNIVVTQLEVRAEIEQVAARFGIPSDRWMQMLKTERGISPERYAADIIWPSLALKKLAAAKLTVSPQERQAALETEFGPQVKARMITCRDPEKARNVHAKAIAEPDSFGNLAKEFSEDVNTRSLNGLIQPIRLHVGDEKIEQVAFNMRPGEVSNVIEVGGQYVILKCEQQLPGRLDSIDASSVMPQLDDMIKERKLRSAAAEIFRELQEHAKIEKVFGDPQKSRELPGVAAVINGRRLTVRELAEECIDRHGTEVLEGVITHQLLEQACREKNVTVTREDIDAEIARAAEWAGKVDANGNPDVAAWMEYVTTKQRVSRDLYIHDSVWPSVALKNLVQDKVEVTDDDLTKGYDANYGPRVICRAIVLTNLRRAQEVWEMARAKPTVENFANLAEEYSAEATTRSTGGEVPPIQKHGGQPLLEKDAFKLKPGEISGIIQVQDRYVILFCEGHTKPQKIEFNEVRDLLYREIHEKKLRIAMADELERQEASAQIDNYLAGESKSPASSDRQPRPTSAEPNLRTPPRSRVGSAQPQAPSKK